MIDPVQAGLKKHHMTTSTVVFMIFCLCAAGAYGIEEMIPEAGPGLTLVMLIVLPFVCPHSRGHKRWPVNRLASPAKNTGGATSAVGEWLTI